ncbi:MAG: outer membrane beta-barrel protein [Candidatus Cryptobacteroides sp.]
MKANMMKAFVAGIILMSAAFSAAAQKGLGLSVGYVSSASITRDADGDRSASPLLNGLRVGASYDLNITRQFMFQPGVYYSYLTDRRQLGVIEIGDYYIADLVNEHFLNMPLHFKYNFEISDAVTGLYVFAGPTLTVGLSATSDIGVANKNSSDYIGNAEFNYYTGAFSCDMGSISQNQLKDYFESQTFRRFDVVMGVGIGLEILDYLDVKLGYDWGLVNRLANTDTDSLIRRSQFYVTAGVRF